VVGGEEVVGKVNWTIVAISAGVTLGAGAAVLGTPAATPPAGNGIIVPQAVAVEESAKPPVRTGQPVRPAPPVVNVVPAGYTQTLVPAPPRVAQVPAPREPVAQTPVQTPVKTAVQTTVQTTAPVSPRQVIRSTTRHATALVNRARRSAPAGWSGWFSESVSPVKSKMTIAATGGKHRAEDRVGRHRADKRHHSGCR
jgi:hypothetical protein